MSDEKSSFQPGEKIGDYEVISVLGLGATGTVYLTQHTGLKKLFAVKVLNGELAFMPEFVRVFQHEAQIVAALSHENIVPVHNFGECGGLYYYVMDFVNGGTLEDVRRRNGGRLRPDAAIALIAAVARGLAYAHGYGVVHRDLKPENILLTRTGTPQITDFGMAYVDRRHIAGQRRMEERRRAKSSSKFRSVVGLGGNAAAGTPSQTQIAIEENSEDNPEVEGGTEGYIAPEVARGNAATPRADVYALGALLHFLLVGETPPEPGRLSPEIFKLHNRPLTHLLERSLSLVPTRRYPTAKEFLEALERVSSASARFRRTVFAVGAVLIIAAAFAFAFSFGEKSQLRKTENRVAAAAQKIFEAEPLSPESVSDKKTQTGSAPERGAASSAADVSESVPLSVSVPEIADAESESVRFAASASSGTSSSPAETAEREYWERFCQEKTGRRGVVVGFLDDDGNAAVKKVSRNEMLYFVQHVPAGTYNIYFRASGTGRAASVPVRLSIGGDSVSRVMKFSGAEEKPELRFFAIIDVSAASEHVRIEIPNTRNADLPEIGFSEIEIRPTFSNADFSRMFGEFLSVLSEK